MTPHRTRWIRALDVLLWLSAAWFVLVPLLFGRAIEIPLPLGGHISGSLTQSNLLVFWALLLARLGLAGSANEQRAGAGLSVGTEGLLIGAACLVIYLACSQDRVWPSGDTIPTKLVPISLLEEGNLDLNEFVRGIPFDRRYGLYWTEGRAFSAYPPAPALVALPVYSVFRVLAPAAFRSWREAYSIPGGDDLPNVANLMEQISAALIAALAAVAFWRLCLRVTGGDRRASRWFTVALALGTPLMSTASQALWQNGPACLFIVLMFYLLLPASEARGSGPWFAAGLCGGLACACRPTAALVAGFAFLWVLAHHPRRAAWFLAPAGAVAAAFMLWNYRVFGNVAGGGYGQNLHLFTAFDARVLWVHLFSPSRGLFAFSPFLLFAAVLGGRQAAREPLSLASFGLYGALATAVLFSCWTTWSGGVAFGPRYLTEAALLLAMALPAGFRVLAGRRWARIAFVLAVLFSCHLHIMGARHGDGGWTNRVFKGDDLPSMWDVRHSQLVGTLLR